MKRQRKITSKENGKQDNTAVTDSVDDSHRKRNYNEVTTEL